MAPHHAPDEPLRRVRRELARLPPVVCRVVLAANAPGLSLPRTALTWPRFATGIAGLLLLMMSVGEMARRPATQAAGTGAPVPLPSCALETVRPPLPRPTSSSVETDTEPLGHASPEQFTVEVVNTGQSVNVVLSGPASEPDEASYLALRHELRALTGAEGPVDLRLVELLHQIAARANGSVQVLSAYRPPKTAHDTNYHSRGMAADIRVAGMTTAQVRDVARAVGATGIGYYPTSKFVHVDMRDEPFHWTDTSGPGQNPDDRQPMPPIERETAHASPAGVTAPLPTLASAMRVDAGAAAPIARTNTAAAVDSLPAP